MTRQSFVSVTPPDPLITHHILVVDDPSGRRAFRLETSAYSIGRDPTCSIVVQSPSVSRQHALLVRMGGTNSAIGYRIYDGNSQGKASRNGLVIRGSRCSSCDLLDGDVVEFGHEVRACYYVRTMTQTAFDRYTQTAPFRRIKAAPLDRVGTVADAEHHQLSPESTTGT